jgi:hypothetical protein
MNNERIVNLTSPVSVRIVVATILVIVAVLFARMAAIRSVSVSSVELLVVLRFVVIVSLLGRVLKWVMIVSRRERRSVFVG